MAERDKSRPTTSPSGAGRCVHELQRRARARVSSLPIIYVLYCCDVWYRERAVPNKNSCLTTSYVGLYQLLRSSARRTETTPLVWSILQPNFGPGSAQICWAIRMRPGIGTANLERLTIYPRIGGNGAVPADEISQSLASCSWLAPKYRISIPEFRSESLSVS